MFSEEVEAERAKGHQKFQVELHLLLTNSTSSLSGQPQLQPLSVAESRLPSLGLSSVHSRAVTLGGAGRVRGLGLVFGPVWPCGPRIPRIEPWLSSSNPIGLDLAQIGAGSALGSFGCGLRTITRCAHIRPALSL